MVGVAAGAPLMSVPGTSVGTYSVCAISSLPIVGT